MTEGRPPLSAVIRWVAAFVVLVAFQLLGTALVALTGVRLPGPVVGVALLAIALVAGGSKRRERRDAVAPAADALTELLPLLFVPAGVGILQYLTVLDDYLLAVVVALVGSFVLTSLVTGGVLELFLRRAHRRPR